MPIDSLEVKAIRQFIKNGGRLALMIHIPQPFFELLQSLGVSVSNQALYEQENIIGSKPRDFSVLKLQSHPLSFGLKSFSVFGGWALKGLNDNVTEIAYTSEHAWVDLNRNGKLDHKDVRQAFAVVACGKLGLGSFVVFGDDAIFQNQFLEKQNKLLAANLVNWFISNSNPL